MSFHKSIIASGATAFPAASVSFNGAGLYPKPQAQTAPEHQTALQPPKSPEGIVLMADATIAYSFN